MDAPVRNDTVRTIREVSSAAVANNRMMRGFGTRQKRELRFGVAEWFRRQRYSGAELGAKTSLRPSGVNSRSA
jgi:hypothetical protein